MVDIGFAEDLEDIISLLGEEASLHNFGSGDKAYISFKDFDFVISKFFDKAICDYYFTCEVVKNGFYLENPNIVNLYREKRFSKLHLVTFLKNFKDKTISITNRLEINEGSEWENFFKAFDKKKFILKGINYSYWVEWVETGRDYEKGIEESEILYISNGKEHYRLEFFTIHGMCPSGYAEASWGNLEVQKLDILPNAFQLEALDDDYFISLISNESHFNQELVFEVLSKKRGFGLSPFAFWDGEGGDSWYPSGFAYTNYSKDDLLVHFKNNLAFPEDKEIIDASLKK